MKQIQRRYPNVRKFHHNVLHGMLYRWHSLLYLLFGSQYLASRFISNRMGLHTDKTRCEDLIFSLW